MSDDGLPRVDRRTTLKWLAATIAASQPGCGRDEPFVGSEIPSADPAAAGYGKDPDLMQPAVPWPRTLNSAQLATAAALCDLVLPADERSPAASELGIADFIDEWASAPYPQQRADRELFLAGFGWLDDAARAASGQAFAAADAGTQAAIVARLAAAPDAGLAPQHEFFRRFRFVAAGAYYTTDAGMRDIGYTGNVAISGAYPGPSDEALAHLASVLDDLGLDWPG